MDVTHSYINYFLSLDANHADRGELHGLDCLCGPPFKLLCCSLRPGHGWMGRESLQVFFSTFK